MDRIDMEDVLRNINDYVDLLWCTHLRYEPSINLDEMTQYKIGIQTFILKIKEELDSLNLEEE